MIVKSMKILRIGDVGWQCVDHGAEWTNQKAGFVKCPSQSQADVVEVTSVTRELDNTNASKNSSRFDHGEFFNGTEAFAVNSFNGLNAFEDGFIFKDLKTC